MTFKKLPNTAPKMKLRRVTAKELSLMNSGSIIFVPHQDFGDLGVLVDSFRPKYYTVSMSDNIYYMLPSNSVETSLF
tara:strand:+ start:347 stop:577 length:231 start_codon:yes stop_codon:yes gene_type:complete